MNVVDIINSINDFFTESFDKLFDWFLGILAVVYVSCISKLLNRSIEILSDGYDIIVASGRYCIRTLFSFEAFDSTNSNFGSNFIFFFVGLLFCVVGIKLFISLIKMILQAIL